MSASEKIDREMLAVLLWDFFGPSLPKDNPCVVHALPGHISAYRRAADDIIASLDFNAAVERLRSEKSA